jgi:hypothetical protein
MAKAGVCSRLRRQGQDGIEVDLIPPPPAFILPAAVEPPGAQILRRRFPWGRLVRKDGIIIFGRRLVVWKRRGRRIWGLSHLEQR